MKQSDVNKKQKVAFIRARWHSEIVDQALKGFQNHLEKTAPDFDTVDVFDVPGAFEIPLLAQKLAKTGRYDAIVAAGFVVDGGIYRHDFVATAVINGLMRVQLDENIPVFSVVLTPHHFHESEFHNTVFFEHFLKKGREAAEAVIALYNTTSKAQF